MNTTNYNIYYTDKGEGTPILMIHGLTLSSYSYRENVQTLIENNFRVIQVDLPGHGLSKIPPEDFNFSVENISDTIFSLMKKLNINEFNIVGHSMGAVISLYLTQKHPNNIKNIIIIDSPIFGAPHKLFLTYPLMGYLTEIFLGKLIIKKYLTSMYYDRDKIDDQFIDRSIDLSNKKGYWLMLSKFFKEVFSKEFEKMKSNYHDFNTNTLVLWGEKDKWLSLEVAKKFNDLLPNSELIIFKNCGHNPHEECSEDVNKEIIDFLKNNKEI